MASPECRSSPLWPSSVSSESQSVKSSVCSQDEDVYCVLKVGEIHRYTIPSFSVITVYLRHARVQTEDEHGTVRVLDVFFHDEANSFFGIRVPAEVRAFESCFVQVWHLPVPVAFIFTLLVQQCVCVCVCTCIMCCPPCVGC